MAVTFLSRSKLMFYWKLFPSHGYLENKLALTYKVEAKLTAISKYFVKSLSKVSSNHHGSGIKRIQFPNDYFDWSLLSKRRLFWLVNTIHALIYPSTLMYEAKEAF